MEVSVKYYPKTAKHRTYIRRTVLSTDTSVARVWAKMAVPTCYIGMSLNKQFILGKSATEEQGVDWMPSFVHAFYDVTGAVLEKN